MPDAHNALAQALADLKKDKRAHTLDDLKALATAAGIDVDFGQRKSAVLDDLAIALDHTDGSDELETALAVAAKLETEVSELRKALTLQKKAIAALEASLEASSAAKPAPAPSTPLGALSSPSGVFLLASTEAIEKTWKTKSGNQATFAVDFVGPHAHYLAHRMHGGAAPIELADGTWRVSVPSVGAAQHQLGAAQSWLSGQADGHTTTVSLSAVDSSALQALDATRATGIGRSPLGLAIAATSITVSHDAKTITIKL